MADVSQMIASFRAQNPVATLGKDDKQVADLMLAQKGVGALTYAEAEMLMKAFSGEPDKIGDNPTFLADKEPQMPQEDEAGWKKPALFAGGAIATVAAGAAAVAAGIVSAPVLIGGAAVAGLALFATSCSKTDVVENNNSVVVDFSGLAKAITDLVEENKALRSDIKTYLEALIDKIDNLSATQQTLIKTVISQLEDIKEGDKAKQELLKQILDKIDKGNANEVEMLNKILNAISGLDENSSEFNKLALELLGQILNTNVEGNAQNKDFFNQILGFISDFKNTAPEIADKFTGILNEIMTLIKDGTEIDKAGFESIIALLKEFKNTTPEFVDKFSGILNEITTLIKDGTAVDKAGFEAVVAALQDVKSSDAAGAEGLAQILQNMWGDIVNGQKETIDILNQLAENNLTGNKELQELISNLYADSQVNATARHEEVVKAINNVAANVKSLEGTVKSTGNAVCEEIRNLSADLKAMFEDYKAGNIDAKEILERLDGILGGVVEGNVLSTETNDLLTKLLDKAGNITGNPDATVNDYSQILQQILDAINKVVAGVEDIKIGLNENNAGIVAALQEIIENQDEQTTTLKDVQEEIKKIGGDLKAFAEASTENQEKLLNQGNDILAAIQQIGVDMNKGVGDIIAQLKGDHADLAAQLAAMADALGVKMDENGQAIVNAINGLEANIDAVKDAIENIVSVGGSQAVDLTTTNNLIQTVINLLNRPTTGGNVDLGEVTQLLTKNNELMEALLAKEGPDMDAFMDALVDIKDAVKNINITNGNGQAVDLSTTNNLIQTCVQQLQSLVQAQSENSDIMASVTNLGTQLTEVIAKLQTGNVTTDEINAKLDQIMEAIKKISG